ncbi:MAG: preprotein translocase subunit SecA [Proteobacteria bacterium]|nr:MAG: preprotein translocase subunit SecA [Pseudomonadota bacterium]
MFANVLTKVFGSRNERLIKQMGKIVEQINQLESEYEKLDDDALKAKTEEFRRRAADGASDDSLLPETFAVVREASKRTLGLRHFDAQLIGGMVLNDGKIAEMKTGEGKTLVATLAAYHNAVLGKTVHIITVNDYLAQRDADWMGQIYRFLGLEVGVILSGQNHAVKKNAYACDIVYGTNNEYGFDYLRDNMAFTVEDRVQRSLDFAIVDEVDSILIDEARTPLIISGPAEESTDLYAKINTLVPHLKRQQEEDGPGDYYVDEKARQAFLTEEGNETAEELLRGAGLLAEESGLYDVANISLLHHLNAAVRAYALFQRDVDYIVRDGKVVIIDEFTGRMMEGRRWSEGLHQAVEAKEGVPIQQENQTLASITFQNYFRLYDKLSGMTGTADTEAPEFQQIYGLEVVVIPTHRPMVRDDQADLVYRTAKEKFTAIVEAIKESVERRQPVLVGTASIETSEYLSGLLKKEGIRHEVLNAKHHEREAQIIAEAGRPGAVTIATNMAGRGTDIVLGGNLQSEIDGVEDESKLEEIRDGWKARHEEVLRAGGLHVLGTERNESRRVDNQLRGRSGRQGDPGSSRFFLSMEDSLMRIFGSERVAGLMQKLGMEEGEAIEHPWVTRAIENSQKKVEGRNFDIRKQLLEYDDVANEQRKVVYTQRDQLMRVDDISEYVQSMRDEVVTGVIDQHIPPDTLEEQWDVPGLENALESEFGVKMPVAKWLEEDESLHEENLRRKIREIVDTAYQEKEKTVGGDVMRHLEKAVMLRVLDDQWKEHLANMDYLRQGIGLRGYAQKNPKQEYKRESFEMFQEMLARVRHDVVAILSRIQVRAQSEVEAIQEQSRPDESRMAYVHPDAEKEEVAEGAAADGGGGGGLRLEPRSNPEPVQTFVRDGRKVGRNEPCPCGSGKKYKQCHGKL